MTLDPLILWAVTGLLVGILIRLAGGGGGIIAIPTLMILGALPLKLATGYALISVAIASLLAWFVQRKHTQFHLSLTIVFTSVITAYITAGYKHDIPQWVDISLLWIVCSFGLYKIWTLKSEHLLAENPSNHNGKNDYLLAALCGCILGPLVTIIGAGGGLVTVTWLMAVNKLPIKKAVATDVFSILLVAPFSAWAQGRFDLPAASFVSLVVGIAFAIVLFGYIKRLIPPNQMLHVRRAAMSFALIAAMLSSLIKSHSFEMAEDKFLGDIHAESSDRSSTL